jgi:hypothetical protein
MSRESAVIQMVNAIRAMRDDLPKGRTLTLSPALADALAALAYYERFEPATSRPSYPGSDSPVSAVSTPTPSGVAPVGGSPAPARAWGECECHFGSVCGAACAKGRHHDGCGSVNRSER